MPGNFPTADHPERAVDLRATTAGRFGATFLTARRQSRMGSRQLRADADRRRALIAERLARARA
jgi:hypothetical protein